MKAALTAAAAAIEVARLKLALNPSAPTPSLPVGLKNGDDVVVSKTTTERWDPATFRYDSGPLAHLQQNRDIQP